MVLIGGPSTPGESDGRQQAGAAARHGLFRSHCIHAARFPHAGMGRRVHPGFCSSPASCHDFERHISAHLEMFNHLVEGTATPPKDTAIFAANIPR
jgi:poly(3-hydroxybutyrate) depolymerase